MHTKYQEDLLVKAERIFNSFEYFDSKTPDGIVGYWKHPDVFDFCIYNNTDAGDTEKNKEIAITLIAKHINRRGNKKNVRLKDFIFYNKMNLPMSCRV